MTAQRNARTWLAVTAGALFATGTAGSAFAQGNNQAKKENLSTQVAKKGNLDITINFEFDSAALDGDSQTGLDELVMWAKDHDDRQIVIAGHTDEVGSEQYNLELGERRAGAAREYLIAHGVPSARISILSYGETMPASSSDAQNRRAVFVVQRPRVAAGAGLDVNATGNASLDTEPSPMAPEPTPAPMYTASTDPSRSHLITPAGMSFVVGGGVMNFTDSNTNDATDMGGMWEARLTYGTRSLIGVEAAYVGSAQDIDALGLDTSAVLLGSSAEAALRVGIPYIPYVQPYAIAGVGVTRFSLVNENFNTSSVDDSETAVDFPLGLGIGFASNGFLFDVRGVYRPMTQDDLLNIPEETDDDENGSFGLDTWSATAHLGVEF